jgi:hypothetical protein
LPTSVAVVVVVAITTALPSSFARRFFIARASGSGFTDTAGVSSSSSLDWDEDDVSELEFDDDPSDVSSSELGSESEGDAALRFNLFIVAGLLFWSEFELGPESGLEVDFVLCFDTLGSSSSDWDEDDVSELEPDGDPSDVSSSELESESEEDAALRFNLFIVAGLLFWSEFELGLEPGLEFDFVLCFDTLGSSSSSPESESELELELTSGDDLAGFFARATSLLLPLFLEVGTDFESVWTLDSSLESEPVSSVDSSSLSTSSAEESVLLESRWDSDNFATCGTASWELSSLSSLLSPESMWVKVDKWLHRKDWAHQRNRL